MILGDCISLMQLGSTCPIRGATRREQASQIKAFSHSSIASWRECDLGSTRFVDKRCVNMLGSPWSSRQYQSDMGEHGEVYITLWSDAKELFFSTWTQIYGCWFQWRPHSYFFHFFLFFWTVPSSTVQLWWQSPILREPNTPSLIFLAAPESAPISHFIVAPCVLCWASNS